MTISFLSGAYKNAGDFLIEERCIAIIKQECTGAVINKYLRSELGAKYHEINAADVMVIGGGPLYANDIEAILPLDVCLNKISIPIMILGCGWYGAYGSKSLAHRYSFKPKTLDFLKKVDAEGLGLGCRDIYSVLALKANGIENAVMTGCPAWYELSKIELTLLKNENISTPKIIAISDPALPTNFDNAINVTKHIVANFPCARVKYVFHRGLSIEDARFKKYYDNLRSIANVEVLDIANDAKGFSVYDSCDLHIGFRVHAHIYNLSIRNRTVLIEEDGRGSGVNEALGLVSIKAYNDQFMISSVNKIARRLIHYFPSVSNLVLNNDLINEIDTYLNILECTNYQYLTNAFTLQKNYYQSMKRFVCKLNTL